jgi:hypothetical protein
MWWKKLTCIIPIFAVKYFKQRRGYMRPSEG